MDVDSIGPGQDFVRVLHSAVDECDAFLAVIGKGWSDARDEDGKRRLDDPADFVRIEIESALKLEKYLIPVLVNGAVMPKPDGLPESLRPLTGKQYIALSHESFRNDSQRVMKALQSALGEAETARQIVRNAKARAVDSTHVSTFPAAQQPVDSRAATFVKRRRPGPIVAATSVASIGALLIFFAVTRSRTLQSAATGQGDAGTGQGDAGTGQSGSGTGQGGAGAARRPEAPFRADPVAAKVPEPAKKAKIAPRSAERQANGLQLLAGADPEDSQDELLLTVQGHTRDNLYEAIAKNRVNAKLGPLERDQILESVAQKYANAAAASSGHIAASQEAEIVAPLYKSAMTVDQVVGWVPDEAGAIEQAKQHVGSVKAKLAGVGVALGKSPQYGESSIYMVILTSDRSTAGSSTRK